MIFNYAKQSGMWRLLVLLILVAVGALNMRAVEADTTIYFVNIYAGQDVYELDGHSAIAVEIAGQEPMSYNYGVFDFKSPNFIYRFVKGETDYMAVEFPLNRFLMGYAYEGRRVVMHELNFDSEQKARLIAALKENVKPENAVYRYNYVKDNCATRPLRAVELAAGDSIILGPAPIEANSSIKPTFRSIMTNNHRNYPWYQYGIDTALGLGVDYALNRREMAFAPVELDGMLADATIGGRKLVKKSIVVVDVPTDNAVLPPTPWYLSPMCIACIVLLLAVALTIRDLRRRRVTRWFDSALFGIFGTQGLVLTFLIFISVHEATSPNWIYAWLNPLCLLVPILIWIKRAKIVLICYQFTNFAVLLAFLAAWAFIPQTANAAFWPLILAEMLRSANYVLINRRKS